MKDQQGPRTVVVPAHSYRTCSGCTHFNHRLVKSGLDPKYVNYCSHPDIPKGERLDGFARQFWGNLPKGHEHKTPEWCPFLQPKQPQL